MARRVRKSGQSGPHGVGGLWMGTKREEDSMAEGALEVTLEELEDFLEGGRHGIQARPEFKEGLRERLWALVQQRRRRWRRRYRRRRR